MKDIEVDFRLISIALCISILIGCVLWLGYGWYINLTKNEDEGIANFEGNMESNIESMGDKGKNTINEDFFLVPDIKKKYVLNNENAIKDIEDWATVQVNHKNYTVQYIIPDSTIRLQGQNIASGTYDMSNWTENGNYEDFIEDFIKSLKGQDKITDIEYSRRKLNIASKEYYIVMRETEYMIASYLCLARDGEASFLEIIVDKSFYDSSLQNTIDKIFSTFTII